MWDRVGRSQRRDGLSGGTRLTFFYGQRHDFRQINGFEAELQGCLSCLGGEALSPVWASQAPDRTIPRHERRGARTHIPEPFAGANFHPTPTHSTT